MVITGLIRNQFDGNVTWVRIPHPPPKLSEKSGISGLFSVIMHILGSYITNMTFWAVWPYLFKAKAEKADVRICRWPSRMCLHQGVSSD